MHLVAHVVSATESGDAFQLLFKSKESHEAGDDISVTHPYFLIQRHFEFPHDGSCYIESHDLDYVGRFRLNSFEFSQSRLILELPRQRLRRVEITFDLEPREFELAERVLHIMTDRLELPDEPGSDV